MSSLRITGFENFVLCCADLEKSLAWYVDTLRLSPVRVDEWRQGTVPFPSVRVNAGTIIDLIPAAGVVPERNVDHFCLLAGRATVDAIVADPETFQMSGERGVRFGAQGDGWSVYVYDPDNNPVEIRSYDQ
jgi:catechol 2,3-dioxygenase-like lactoylglutathione lyase family enzyme